MTDPTPVDRFTWERALRADPDVIGTRLLVLMTVGTYMDAQGTGSRPSQAAVAEATGLRERAVREHLSAAVSSGWLIRVQRGHRLGDGSSVASTYRASLPQPASSDRLSEVSTGTPTPVESTSTGTTMPVEEVSTGAQMPVEKSQPASGRTSTGTGVPPTTYDHELTTSPRAVTHEEPPPEGSAGKGKITPKRIFAEMARRKLGLAREQNAAWAPPEGCDPRREKAWLDGEVAALRQQHGFALDELIARNHPWAPAKPKHADPDWYVFRLDRTLARRDWMQPTAEETRSKLDRERAEREAAYDPEIAEAGRQEALALRDRLLAERRQRHLKSIPA